MKISIGNDHAGPEYKQAIVAHLESHGFAITNYGTDTLDSVDYPDFVHPVAKDVDTKQVDLGILICGSGNGVSMAANKHKEIRAALCWNEKITKLARQLTRPHMTHSRERIMQKLPSATKNREIK